MATPLIPSVAAILAITHWGGGTAGLVGIALVQSFLAGLGFLLEAAIGTAAVLSVHVGLRPVVRWIEAHRRTAADVETYYRIRVTCRNDHEAIIRTILLRHVGSNSRMSIQGLSTEEGEKERYTRVTRIRTNGTKRYFWIPTEHLFGDAEAESGHDNP